MEIFKDRNSYSKTDHDATFMRMKDDYMRNGQLKAGYNLQIATEGQYALAYDIFPNPTDTRTFIPFLNTIEKDYFELPKYIVADAGYGSEQNYDDVLNHRNRTPLITYNKYRKEKKKKCKNDPFKTENGEYDGATDSVIYTNNRRVNYIYESNRTDKYGFNRTFKVYESESCSDCPVRSLCTKAAECKNSKLLYIEIWEDHKEYVR